MFASKRLLICILWLIYSITMVSGANNWEWAIRSGGIQTDYASAITTDGDGNLYITGYYHGTSIIGDTTLNCNGSVACFISKLDPLGNWLWTVQAGGNTFNDCISYDIAVDEDANVFVAGYFTDSVTFGSTTLSCTGSNNTDVFVTKLDTDGNWLWAVKAGGFNNDYCTNLALDSEANVCVSGCFSSAAYFGAHPAYSNGWSDAFVAKLDTNGNWLWVKVAGGVFHDLGMGIAVDNDDNLYVTGDFVESASFGSHQVCGYGLRDAFIAKLDANGNWLWAKEAGGYTACGYALATDYANNVYMAGDFTGIACFGLSTLTSNGKGDAFVAKLDRDGNWLWANNFGSSGWDRCYQIITDNSANAYISGFLVNDTPISSPDGELSGYTNVFLAKLGCWGNWVWTEEAGGVTDDYCYGIALDGDSSIFITGDFEHSLSFGSHNITSNGAADMFIAKYNQFASAGDDFVTPELPFILLQNYPNPFNPSTTISFQLPRQANANLSIYNAKGQLVTCLLDGVLSPGKHNVVWNGLDANNRRVASGMYIYRLSTPANTQVKKMMLLK